MFEGYQVHVTYFYLRTSKENTGYFETEFFNVNEYQHPILYYRLNGDNPSLVKHYLYGLCHELFLSNGENSGLCGVAFEIPKANFSIVVRPGYVLGGVEDEGE